MTLALIVLIVFLVVWFFDSAKKKEDKRTYKERTITNVKRQDELSKNNFKKIIEDLQSLPSVEKLSGGNLLDAIEALYDRYNVPDRRTIEEKTKDRTKYLNMLERDRELDDYPVDDSELSLLQKIWYPLAPPLIDRLDLLFGIADTTLIVDDVTYKYDHRGIPSNLYHPIPAKLIGDLEVLLTIRDLDADGLNYSWNRQESSWQQSDMRIKQYEENKKRYPWLYK